MFRRVAVLALLATVMAACGSSAEESVDEGNTSATPETSAASSVATADPDAATTVAETTAASSSVPIADPYAAITVAETTAATEAVATSEAATTEAAADLSGLLLTTVVFGDHVTITNHTSEEVSLDGWWMCNRPSYAALSGTLAPGESIDVSSDDLGGLAASEGEVGLYTERAFGDASAMVDYVAWGAGGGRESVAVQAGLWTDGAAAPNDGPGVVRSDSPSGAESWVSG